MVLTGSNALLLHGLSMSRTSSDLDIAIYKPTTKQLEILSSLAFFDTIDEGGRDNYGDKKVYKFKKDGHSLDIHIGIKETPSCAMYTKIGGEFFKVQSVAKIVEYKKSYRLRAFSSIPDQELKFYARKKDMLDLQDLKNRNFNWEG